jgi:hypothetical protein
MVPIGLYNTYKLNWTHVDYFLDWLEFLFRQLLSLYMKKTQTFIYDIISSR